MNYILVGLGLLFTAVAVAAIRHSRRESEKPSANEEKTGKAVSPSDGET